MLGLSAVGVNVTVQCAHAQTRALLAAHYGPMRGRRGTAELHYTVAAPNGKLVLARDGAEPLAASDPGELLLLLDQDLIIHLQKVRRDLYFIHAGVLEIARRAIMLVAPSGGGKSTLAWALAHHGFRYLSDELGPVDLTTLAIHPYPRALLLKSPPPGSYPLPARTLSTSRGFHVVSKALRAGVCVTPAPVAAIFFVRHGSPGSAPAVSTLSAAQAGARLYTNALNPLAHPGDGLDGALQIASQSACFELSVTDLTATCTLVKDTVERLLLH